METAPVPAGIHSFFRRYRMHFLIFIIIFFLGLTFAHPELLLNDEWITVNQLHQVHDGHQLIVNEGKYGYFQNGTISDYFSARSNLLAYSLFLPLISLPAHWVVDILGNTIGFFIVYIWTFILLSAFLFVHYFYRELSYLQGWQWTPAAIGAVFVLFFINLFFYTPLSVYGRNAYPEVLAVVITNIFLLSFAGVLVYEINHTLFAETAFSVFGTIVCFTSSSYVFWSTGCKDHVLTMLLFAGILLCMIKYHKTGDSWYPPLGFLITGLLAWARPELALWVFLAGCAIWGYALFISWKTRASEKFLLLVFSPFFTLLGALPFFLNNFLVTRNPLYPPGVLYLSGETSGLSGQVSASLQQNSVSSGTGIPQIFTMKNPVPSSDIFGDIFGILFHPQNGSMGVLALSPLFLVMLVIALFLFLKRMLPLSIDEIHTIVLITILAAPVFLAYANNLLQLNMSRGITPDIRYLSPVYIPLTLMGLIILRKLNLIDNLFRILAKMLIIAIVGIPLAVYLTAVAYTDPSVAEQLDAPIALAFSLCIFFLATVTIIFLSWEVIQKKYSEFSGTLIAALCVLPFIWQIDISVRFWGFAATGQGYPFWIPVIHSLNEIFMSPLLVH